MFDSWTEAVPTINATKERGPNTAEGIFSPTPKTDDAGAFPSQYEGPGVVIFSDVFAFTPIFVFYIIFRL